MVHQCNIAQYSLKCIWPSWVVYDINYLQAKALNPWATTDGGLYAECFTSMMKDRGELWCRFCHSMEHQSPSCPIAPSSKVPRRLEAANIGARPPAVCINFNTKGYSFKKCRRLHICSNCRGKHLAKSCTSPVPPGVDTMTPSS